MAPILKRSARGILIDGQAHLVLIKRTRPGEAPYWTAPGGGVDPTDASPADALQRELKEELEARPRTGVAKARSVGLAGRLASTRRWLRRPSGPP